MSTTKQVSLHGKRAFISKDDQIVARNGFVAGGDDKPSITFPSPDTVASFEDFITTTYDTGPPIGGGLFKQVTGDTGNGSATRAATGGVFRLFNTPSVTAAVAPAAGKGISGILAWKGNMGPGSTSGRLKMAARVRIVADDNNTVLGRTTNRLHAYVGFTDIATYEYPVWDTGAGVISNPSDYMGFMLSPGGDTGWSGVAAASAANDSGDSVVSVYTGVTSGTYNVLEIDYNRGAGDTGGTVVFSVNGRPLATIDSPVVPTTALAPCIYAFQQDTGSQALDVDWVNVSGPRDTGL